MIPDKKEAVFQLLAEGKEGQTSTFKVYSSILENNSLVTCCQCLFFWQYDFLHATPPMGPLKVLRTSPLTDDLGWVDVNPKTMQHKKYCKELKEEGRGLLSNKLKFKLLRTFPFFKIIFAILTFGHWNQLMKTH